MTAFPSAMDAKRFLVARIAAEALRTGTPLSELEQQELYFTESYETLPDIMDINARFDEQYDAADYEQKITKLMRSAYDHDAKSAADKPGLHDQWRDAVGRLEPEDHYILVMLHAAGITGPMRSDSHKETAPRKPGDLNMKLVLALAAVGGLYLAASKYVDGRFGLAPWSSYISGHSSGFLLLALGGLGALGYVIFDAFTPSPWNGHQRAARESIFRRAGFIALALWAAFMAVVVFAGPFRAWSSDQQIGLIAWTLIFAAAIAAAFTGR
jgi:hypothetical protein